jgi:proline iminopeptidase
VIRSEQGERFLRTAYHPDRQRTNFTQRLPTPRRLSSYARLLEYRRTQPRAPRLERQTVRARGIAFAVFSTPPITGRRPLLTINGGMLFDHGMLWPALAPLAARRQIILYDQRGRGESSTPSDPATARIEDDAEDVGALRRALGIPSWDVLGHSWGGGIAMLSAASDRAGVHRLVTVDAVGPTSQWIPTLRRNALAGLSGEMRNRLERIDERSLTSTDPEVHAEQTQAIYPAWFADPGMAAKFALPRVVNQTGATVLARLRAQHYDWRREVSAVRAPTLVIHGALDPLPVETSLEILSLIPGSTHAVIPDAGHMPFWEAPDVFFPLVESFL